MTPSKPGLKAEDAREITAEATGIKNIGAQTADESTSRLANDPAAAAPQNADAYAEGFRFDYDNNDMVE